MDATKQLSEHAASLKERDAAVAKLEEELNALRESKGAAGEEEKRRLEELLARIAAADKEVSTQPVSESRYTVSNKILRDHVHITHVVPRHLSIFFLPGRKCLIHQRVICFVDAPLHVINSTSAHVT